MSETSDTVLAFVMGHFAIDEHAYTNAVGKTYIPKADKMIAYDKYGLIRDMDTARKLVTFMNKLRDYNEGTHEHSKEVARLSMYLGMMFDFSKSDLYNVSVSGLLHDLGKLNIPERILEKPDSLTPEEREIMDKHTEFGANYLKAIFDANDYLIKTILNHHKTNANGYLIGEIPDSKGIEFVQIVSVSDIWSALNNTRSYRKNLEWPDAINVFREETKKCCIEQKYVNGLFELLEDVKNK